MLTRITDPTTLNESELLEKLDGQDQLVIQYSEPGYSVDALEQLNRLCVLNPKLEIRFYSHGKEGFDCTHLRHLPNVARLSLDCLRAIRSTQELYHLQHLTHLSFEAYDLMPHDFLAHKALHGLQVLRIGESKKGEVDLTPLSHYSNLNELTIAGHSRGIASLAHLPHLQSLTLWRIKNKVELGFVNDMSSLHTLRLVLGGRSSIDEVSHAFLKKLTICRVLGLERFHAAAFPALEALQIEDQIRITTLDFDERNHQLRDLRLLQCKGLTTVTGLKHLANLDHLRFYHTAVDFDTLVAAQLPPQLDVFAFYTSKAREDAVIQKKLQSLGFREFN